MQPTLPLELSSLSSTHPISGTSASPPPETLPVQSSQPKKKYNFHTASRADAAQAAKREIRSRLREDWTWPPDPDLASTSSAGQSGGQVSRQKFWWEEDPYGPNEVEWRERGDDSDILSDDYDSTSNLSSAVRKELRSPSVETLGLNDESLQEEEKKEEGEAYKYFTPDSLSMSPTIPSKKRKRLQSLRDELRWNDGLRVFTQRRDAWTAARPAGPPPPQASVLYSSPGPENPLVLQPTMLLPLPPPLLPSTNIIRKGITPENYYSIYSKSVLQGLAPSVPINLADMVALLVTGWKRDGEWPPKSGDGDGGGVMDGIEAVGKEKGKGGRFLVKKGGVGRGVGRMRRVLGLGGGLGGGEGEEEQI